MQLTHIAQATQTCKQCPLYKTAHKAVPGEGPEDADIVFLGQAPGAEEDRTGRPFVGRAGQVLNELLELAGINRKEVFITSVLKHFPPKNRAPKRSEVKACLPYTHQQLQIIQPKLVVLLGRSAVNAMIGKEYKVTQDHGTIVEKDYKYFISYHPAAALRSPYKVRAKMEADFKHLAQHF